MSSTKKCLGYAQILLAVGALVALSPAARADEIQVHFSVAAGATSHQILIPVANMPVSLTCASNTPGYRGVGQATILRVSPNAFLEWVGMDIATAAISAGYSGTNGDHMIYCSYTDQYLEIQIHSDTAIQVKNNSPIPMTGIITFSW